MSRLKMILMFIIPVAVIVATGLSIYTWVTLQTGTAEVQDKLARAVNDQADRISRSTLELARQVEMIAGLLSENKSAASAIENELSTYHDFYAAAVAFEPQFLKRLKEGKYPDYKLENFSGLLKTPYPEIYCPVIYQSRHEDMSPSRLDISATNYTTNDWYIIAKQSHSGHWTDPFISEYSGHSVCAYSVPFYYRGDFAGVFCAEILFGSFQLQFPQGTLDLSPTWYGGEYFILADNGKIITHSDESRWKRQSVYSIFAEAGRTELYPVLDRILGHANGITRINNWKLSFDGLTRSHTLWFVYSPIYNGMNCTLVATYSEEQVLAALHREVFYYWLGGLFLILALSAAITLTFFRLFYPIHVLTQAAEKIVAGNLQASVDSQLVNSKSDIGILAQAFNNMVASLNDSIEKTVEEESKRKVLERDLDIARDIQKTFLPFGRRFMPDRVDFQMDVTIQPAKEVAGDFFDYWSIDENNVAFLVADVSGKGVPAAMIMIAARTLIRQISGQGKATAEILTEVNEIIQATNENSMFITLFFGFYNIPEGKLQYTNAGHNPPLILLANGKTEWFPEPREPVIGIFPEPGYTTSERLLAPGDLLFIYTDGVTDTTAENGERFGDERLNELVKGLASHDFKEYIPHTIATLKEFSGPHQQDDITVMVIRHGM